MAENTPKAPNLPNLTYKAQKFLISMKKCFMGCPYEKDVGSRSLIFLYRHQHNFWSYDLPYTRHYNSRFVCYPLFEFQKRFLKELLSKILALCMVRIPEQFLIKSGLRWSAYGNHMWYEWMIIRECHKYL